MEGYAETGRLAFRQEGEFWNAYYGLPATMDGALLLGSIHLSFVKASPELKDMFMDLMRKSCVLMLRGACGAEDIKWGDVHAAPESER